MQKEQRKKEAQAQNDAALAVRLAQRACGKVRPLVVPMEHDLKDKFAQYVPDFARDAAKGALN